ncbi:hypothetical protein LJR014_002873 [Arthrobacter sp. LjRoot14]
MGDRLRAAARTGASARRRAQRRVLAPPGGLPRNPAGQGVPGGRRVRHVPRNFTGR